MFTRKLTRLTHKLLLTSIFWGCLALFCAISSPFYIFRSLLQPLARFLHPKWVKIMSTRDGTLFEKVENHHQEQQQQQQQQQQHPQQHQGLLRNVMVFGVVCEGEPNLDKIRKFFSDYVLNYKNFRGYMPFKKFRYYPSSWLSYPFWKRSKDFDLDYHIRLLREFRERSSVSQEELDVFLGEYMSQPFSRKKPPWELLVVKNLVSSQRSESSVNCWRSGDYYATDYSNSCKNSDSGVCANFRREEPKRFALIFRWHHTLADGYSIAKILINIFGGETYHPLMRHPFMDGDEGSMWKEAQVFAGSFLRLGLDTLKLWALQCDRNIWRVSDEIMSGNCHLVTTSKLPYNVARTVSKKRRVSVTTVLFAAVAGGLRQYFIETGQQRRIPKVMRIRLTVPALSRHPVNRLTNYWSYTNLALPVGRPDQLDRFQEVNKAIELLRRSLVPAFVWLLRPLHAALPIWFSQFNVKDRKTTLAGWHFPGPKQELLLLGEYQVQDLICYHPRLLSDAAIGLSVYSYNGSIRFSLCIDKALFPHRESALKLVSLIEKEFFSFQEMGNSPSND